MDLQSPATPQYAIRIGTDNVQVIVKLFASREDVESWLRKIESSPHAVKLEAYEGTPALLPTGQVLVQMPLNEPLNVQEPSGGPLDLGTPGTVVRTLLGATSKGSRGLNL